MNRRGFFFGAAALMVSTQAAAVRAVKPKGGLTLVHAGIDLADGGDYQCVHLLLYTGGEYKTHHIEVPWDAGSVRFRLLPDGNIMPEIACDLAD